MDCRHLRLTNIVAALSSPALKIAVASMLAFCGCSTGSDSSSKPPVAQAAPATKTAPTKPPSAAAPNLGIEELIAREERGQTILQVRFIQPIKEYRHFTLPQPSSFPSFATGSALFSGVEPATERCPIHSDFTCGFTWTKR